MSGNAGGHDAAGAGGNTRSIRARLVLADQLTRDGDLVQAASVYAQVADQYAAAGRGQEAVAIVFRAQSLGPTWFTVKTVGGVLDKLHEEAVPVCTRAAEAHWRGGRVTEALQFYYQATQLDPSDASALIRLAQAYEHQTLYKEATATFVVASRRLLEQGNNGEFIAVAEQILRIDGGHAQTLRELAKAYLRVGEPRRAVAKLTALMQVVPEDPAGYEILAQAFACIGKEDVALSVLTRLSGDLRGQGLYDEATELLARASRWRHDDLQFQRKLATLAKSEVPTRVHGDRAPARPVRAGVMTLGAEDIGRLDDSGIYRDREGTNMLSLDDIAIVDDLAQTRMREDLARGSNTITRAESPVDLAPQRRPMPPQPPAEPPTRVMEDAPTRAPAGRRDPDELPTRAGQQDAAPRTPASRATPRRKPLLQKHEGTIVLDLRDLAVVGESREEEVILDMSDVEEDTNYKLPELIVDEESAEIELAPTDLVTISKRMPGPPPVATAIRPQRVPKAPTMPVMVVRPAALAPLARRAAPSGDPSEEAPTIPPGQVKAARRLAGKPNLQAQDLEEEGPTTMMSIDPADVMQGLFKKKKTGRDRSASLLDKLGPKPRRAGPGPKPSAASSAAARRRVVPRTTTAPQAVVGSAASYPSAPHPAVTQPPTGGRPAVTGDTVPPGSGLQAPAQTGDTHVGARPRAPTPLPTPAAKPGAKGGVRWEKPTAPKRDKPK